MDVNVDVSSPFACLLFSSVLFGFVHFVDYVSTRPLFVASSPRFLLCHLLLSVPYTPFVSNALQAATRQGNLPLPKGHFPRQTALFLAGCGIHFGWRVAGSWASAMCGILIWAAARGCGIPNLWPIREVSGVLPAILAGQ